MRYLQPVRHAGSISGSIPPALSSLFVWQNQKCYTYHAPNANNRDRSHYASKLPPRTSPTAPARSGSASRNAS